MNANPWRADLECVAELVPAGSKVLDLGCGNGDLLVMLAKRKGVTGRGVELSEAGVRQCVARGLSVRQADIDEGLQDYPSGSFDYVVLSQTLPYVDDPVRVMHEMLRIGRRAIVSFPNLGHWRCRLQLMSRGRLGDQAFSPNRWHEAPRARPISIADFKALCAAEGIAFAEEIYLNARGRLSGLLRNSLFATVGLFVVTEAKQER